MAKRRLQCRQVFWRSGRSTASERAGQAPTGQPAPTVAQQQRPARSVGARGGHEGPVLYVLVCGAAPPGPHPTSSPFQRYPNAPALASTDAAVSPVRSATGADDDPSSRRRPFHSPSRSHVQPPPLPVPRSATALRKRPRTDVRSAWSPASSESRLNRPAFSFDQFSVLADTTTGGGAHHRSQNETGTGHHQAASDDQPDESSGRRADCGADGEFLTSLRDRPRQRPEEADHGEGQRERRVSTDFRTAASRR